MGTYCVHGRFFSRCRLPAVGTCQFCGRSYCSRHGRAEPPDSQVCARERCHAKEADLLVHDVFRERALLRNRHGFCGMDGCLGERAGQCSKCQAVFCEDHLRNGNETVRQGLVRFTRPAAFCEHCYRRRKLWAKL